jgi:hypothetical protein
MTHFDKGGSLPTLNIPHISLVGAFDPYGGQVTVLDVDAEVAHPYRIDFDYEGYNESSYIFLHEQKEVKQRNSNVN